MSEKHNRSSNWDEEEKQLFCCVVKEHACIIENKSLNTNTNKLKLKAWEEVHRKFNQLNSRPRDLNQLKVQWKAMKVQARKSCSGFLKEIGKTGGGPQANTPSDADLQTRDLLNPADLMRDQNIYDSDSVVVEINMDTGEASASIYFSMISILYTHKGLKSTCSFIWHHVFYSEHDFVSITYLLTRHLKELGLECSGKLNNQHTFCNFQSTPLFTTQSEVTIPEYNLLQVPQEDAIVAADASEDEVIDEVIPKPIDRTNLTITGLGKKVVKRKPALHSALKPKKAKQDYVKGMISLSEKLKNEEHCRRMQMAEEEHQIKINHLMELQKEKLKREKRLLEMAEEEHSIKIKIHNDIMKRNQEF